MSRYDKLIQAAASRLIGYDSDLARYEVHKTVYMKQQLEDRYHRSLEQMRLKHSACVNESSMNKERSQSSETEVDSYQLENSCEEDRFNSPLNSPSGATAAIKNRGIVENSFPDNFPVVLARHGMGLLKPDLATSDTSQLLREILQNKEKHQLQELANNNNNNTTTNNKNNVNRLNGSNAIQDSSGLITKLLKNTSQQKSSLSDTEKLSCHSTEGSAEESDGESTIEQLPNDEEADVGDVKSGVLLSGVGSQLMDSKEAKRARVENIITSMRHSPSHSICDSQNIQEQRRQKRKQHQPQQHELSPDHSDSKMRKMTKEDFNRQLMELKNQINDMQRKYSALYNAERYSDRSADGGDDDEDCHTTASLSQSASNRMSKLNGEINSNNRENIGLDNSDIDPVHLISQASQMVREQELATKRPIPLSLQSEVQNLATSLKSELSQAVDTIFSRFVQNQALKSLENSTNQSKTPDQAPKERSKSPTNSAEYPSEFYALPRVHDKQTLFDATCRNTPDLPRAHNRALPFPPPPPHHSNSQSLSSFFTQSQVLTSPVYSSEPEQTEALSLVVNTPKKKRTKVTDTRLSPRAARALLQDNCVQVSSAMSDLEKHIPTSFPHILPPMLPTSVAIPNPSLQHSDILGYYREPNYMEGTRSAGHSPLDDQGSPGNTTNSLSDSYMMLKSESYDMPTESDGQMAMISLRAVK